MNRWLEPGQPPMFDIWDRIARRQAVTQACEREERIRRRRNSKSNWTHERQTLSEIEKLILKRHNGSCETDDGEAYLKAALPYLMKRAGMSRGGDLQQSVEHWANWRTPRLDRDTITTAIAEAKQRDEDKRLWWSAQELGDMLCLKASEREQLHITKLRPAGMTKRKFAAYQRASRAAREKARRAAKGARPHEQSAAQLEPWKAHNVSRTTYYRLKAKGALPGPHRERETNSWRPGTEYLWVVSGKSHVAQPIVPGPARKDTPSHSVGSNGHSPGGKTTSAQSDRTRALQLPGEGIYEQRDFLGGLGDWKQLGALLTAYEEGVLPPDLARAVREELRARLLTQKALALRIGISRPHVAKALRGRSGLSRNVAKNLMVWLTGERQVQT